jgi:hypothetical protein
MYLLAHELACLRRRRLTLAFIRTRSPDRSFFRHDAPLSHQEPSIGEVADSATKALWSENVGEQNPCQIAAKKTGQVERISLRIAVLRDDNGMVHFVPHSAITTVSNMTHGWSAAFFEILIGFTEDVDRVIDLIKQLGRELHVESAEKQRNGRHDGNIAVLTQGDGH